MPEESKYILLLDNYTAHSREFDLPPGNISVSYLPPNVTPLSTTYGPKNHTKYEVLLSARFSLQAYESRRDTIRLSTHLHCQRCIFQRCLFMEFSEDKNVRQAWRILWPTIMTAEGASDEEDFAGFNVRNKDTVRETVSMFIETLDAWNPDCEVSQVNVEE